jgi:hypothetical protein
MRLMGRRNPFSLKKPTPSAKVLQRDGFTIPCAHRITGSILQAQSA